MADGVTTRLQRNVTQLQKEVAKFDAKLNGVTDQMRVEIQSEMEKGLLNIQNEMEKMLPAY